jgi:hypothetical protein
MAVHDPIEKLSAGPIHFSFSGWAFVDILPESAPSPDENFYLIYNHPFSFESDAWLKHGRKTNFPVCIMNAGYSSGWCEESFGLRLVSTEVECLAKGDSNCQFNLRSACSAYRPAAYRCGVETHERKGIVRSDGCASALNESYLHVRVHRRCSRTSRSTVAQHGVLAEAVYYAGASKNAARSS